jgi:hypothetical protein
MGGHRCFASGGQRKDCGFARGGIGRGLWSFEVRGDRDFHDAADDGFATGAAQPIPTGTAGWCAAPGRDMGFENRSEGDGGEEVDFLGQIGFAWGAPCITGALLGGIGEVFEFNGNFERGGDGGHAGWNLDLRISVGNRRAARTGNLRPGGESPARVPAGIASGVRTARGEARLLDGDEVAGMLVPDLEMAEFFFERGGAKALTLGVQARDGGGDEEEGGEKEVWRHKDEAGVKFR